VVVIVLAVLLAMLGVFTASVSTYGY
jgi:hypothetical protein